MRLGPGLLKARGRAAVPGAESVGLHGVRKARAMMPVHALAEADNRCVWPHWTTTPGGEIAKAADTCGTRCEGRESYTELFRD